MAKIYRLAQVPFLAFFSEKLYRDVGCNWRGANLAYLFLLLAICCLPPARGLSGRALRSLESGGRLLAGQLPDIRIRDGRALIDQRRPCFIRRRDGSPLAIIDTTGSMNYIDDGRVLALLTEERLVVRTGTGHFSGVDLARIADLDVDKAAVAGLLGRVEGALAPLSYGALLLCSYLLALLVLLPVATIGLVAARCLRSRIGFAGVLRMATAAATPSIVCIAVSATLNHDIPVAIHLGVTLAYLCVGIRACVPATGGGESRINLVATLRQADLVQARAA